MNLSPAQFLAALQLADSAFPNGMYTQSHGLETLTQEAQVTTVHQVEQALRLYLTRVYGPTDATALAWSHRLTLAGDLAQIAQVDRRLTACKLGRESREISLRIGRYLARTVAETFALPLTYCYGQLMSSDTVWLGNQAVLCGVLYAEMGVPVATATLAALSNFCTSWLSAGLRLGLLDHRDLQAILHRMAPDIEATASAVESRRWQAMGATVPYLEVAGMRHSFAETRLFVT